MNRSTLRTLDEADEIEHGYMVVGLSVSRFLALSEELKKRGVPFNHGFAAMGLSVWSLEAERESLERQGYIPPERAS